MTARTDRPDTSEALSAAAGTSSIKLRWVWAAMAPAERRHRLTEMKRWVEWLLAEYPRLSTKIPHCWYRHPEGLNRLTALYVGWVRTYVEAANQRDSSLVEWHDALDRVTERLGYPSRCVAEGAHQEQHTALWRTDDHFHAWRGSSAGATHQQRHPTPQFARRATRRPPAGDRTPAAAAGTGQDFTTVLTRERLQSLLDTGAARMVTPEGPVRYDDHWWIGRPGGMHVRIPADDPFSAALDETAARYERSQAEADQQTDRRAASNQRREQ
ncbi:hypothetical protein GCM10010411_76070 [Actinomadura fulvescens]|uniref:Uncharacterized protein n=1 Tax=Actinomadura fulvescens TaxID=46160 RepID=A0ABP6CYL9_9ACTN